MNHVAEGVKKNLVETNFIFCCSSRKEEEVEEVEEREEEGRRIKTGCLQSKVKRSNLHSGRM